MASDPLINCCNYHPNEVLTLLKELLTVYYLCPRAVIDATDEFKRRYWTGDEFYSFDCQNLVNMIATSFPNYSGNIVSDISKKKIDGITLSNILDLLPRSIINYTKAISNINVLQGTIGTSLFGFVLYADEYFSNDALEIWKVQINRYCDWGIAGRYNETDIHNLLNFETFAQNQVVTEGYEPCLDKNTHLLLFCSSPDGVFLSSGEPVRQFTFIGTQSFLNKLLVLPPIDELSTLDNPNVLKTYKKQYQILKYNC